MNRSFDFFRNRIGLKDSKQLAKALHRAIQSTPLSSPTASKEVISSISWPPVQAEHASPSPPAASLLPEGTDPCHKSLITLEPHHPCSFVSLGKPATSYQDDLFFQNTNLHWTHRGALSGGLLLGARQDRHAVLEQMVQQAALAGQSVLWVTEASDSRHVDRLAQALTQQGQGHRLRSLNLLPGAHTHTFNPMAQHSAASIRESLVHALRHRCPLLNMSLTDWTRFLITAMSAIALTMVHYCQQQKMVPDIALFLDFCSLTKLKELEQQEEFPLQLRTIVQAFLREANQLQEGYDSVLNWLHKEEILGALTGTFGHVFNARRSGGLWLLPDVSIRDIAYGNLVTVVTVPSGATVANQLILNQLSLEFYVRSNREHMPHAVRHLIVLDSVGSYGTEVVLQRLQQFSPLAGLATVLADESYAAFKRIGPEAKDIMAMCQTKLFIQGTQAPKRLHVLEGGCMYQIHLPVLPPLTKEPPYVPQTLGRTLEGGQVQLNGFLERATEVLWKSAREHTGPVNLAWCQDTMARILGYAHWHDLEQQKRP